MNFSSLIIHVTTGLTHVLSGNRNIFLLVAIRTNIGTLLSPEIQELLMNLFCLLGRTHIWSKWQVSFESCPLLSTIEIWPRTNEGNLSMTGSTILAWVVAFVPAGSHISLALHFIYTLAEARFPCRLLNHLGMALVQMQAGSWFLCGLLNSLGTNIAQTPTGSSVPEACCFHLLTKSSGNKKRGAILQATSENLSFFLSLF